jgi:hypothetical protein
MYPLRLTLEGEPVANQRKHRLKDESNGESAVSRAPTPDPSRTERGAEGALFTQSRHSSGQSVSQDARLDRDGSLFPMKVP